MSVQILDIDDAASGIDDVREVIDAGTADIRAAIGGVDDVRADVVD